MKVRRVYRVERCPRCKGKGRVRDIPGSILTFGILAFFETLDPSLRDECPVCKGRGEIEKLVEVKKLFEESED